MRPRNYCRVAAFTLVELLVALAIIVPVTVFSMQMLTRGLDVWEILSCRSDLRVNGQRVMALMIQELRSATRTAGAIPPDAIVSALPDNTSMRFYLPQDADGNGTIVNSVGETEWGNVPVFYQLNTATNALERVQGGTTQVLAINVADVRFDDITTDDIMTGASLSFTEVRIRLQMDRTTPTYRRPISEIFTGRVRLRN